MIPKECKRLAEVDFPIAEVSRHAAREKSIRHGHPSTLHLWWARRPLASSRAVLMALLLPDPCDPHCPKEFKTRAKELLLAMRGRPSGWNSTVKTDEGLRQVLLRFIADFANWDNAAKTEYLDTGRGLVQAAHPEQTPLVVDPFAGGGSIPLEALRLGCDAFASDLNPVACLILKVMLEDIPRHGPGLADELRKAGAEIKAQAEKELADLYPKDPDGATPIAYLWARTVRCEAPNCGAEIPLMRSMWLCRKPKRKWALRTNVVRDRDDGVPPRVEFGIFEPKADRKVADGTVTRARATYEHGSCYCQYLPAHVFIFPMIGTSWVAVHGSLVSWVHNGWRPASPTPTVGLSWRSPQPRRVARRPGQAPPATGLYSEVWRAWVRRRALPSPQRPAAVRSTLPIWRWPRPSLVCSPLRSPLRGSFSWPLARALSALP